MTTYAPSEDSDQPGSLATHWVYSEDSDHFVCFVMQWLIVSRLWLSTFGILLLVADGISSAADGNKIGSHLKTNDSYL